MAGTTALVLGVDERGTADAAMTAYRTQLADSQIKSKDTKGARDEQKNTPESGIGGAASLPHEKLRNLMQAVVSH